MRHSGPLGRLRVPVAICQQIAILARCTSYLLKLSLCVSSLVLPCGVEGTESEDIISHLMSPIFGIILVCRNSEIVVDPAAFLT